MSVTRLLSPKDVNIFKEQKYRNQNHEPNLWPRGQVSRPCGDPEDQ